MDILIVTTLIVTGWVGCAEFASVTLVHPVIRRLDAQAQLVMEKGLVGTFGRVMPVAMTLATVVTIVVAVQHPTPWWIAAAGCLAIALAITIVVNVPINAWTRRLGTTAPQEFASTRRRWDAGQLARGSLQFAAFVLSVVAASAGPS